MSATRLWKAGFDPLVSVTPPNAEIGPHSNLSPDSLGKAPGLRGSNGWYGYAFTTQSVLPEKIDQSGANVGLLAREYPGLDIDVEDEQLARFVQQEAEKVLGPAPIRTSREPRRLLVYKTDTPFAKIRCKINWKNQQHVVEMLADGQQYVVHGRHPSGVDYGWDGMGLSDLHPTAIMPVDREQVLDFFRHLKDKLAGRAEVKILGTGESSEALAPPQEELKAPSLEELEACVKKIPNDLETRDEYIAFGHAVKAAGGPEAEYIFQEWAGRWTDGHNDPETVSADWGRMRPPFRIGWSWLAERAGNLAQMEFEAVEGATPPEEPPNRASIFDRVQWCGNVKHVPAEFLVDGMFLDSNINLIGAESGAYKTTLALHVAVGVATGTDVLGHEVKRTGSVLVVSEEDDAGTLDNRVRALAAGAGVEETPNIGFLALEGFGLSDEKHHEDLKQAVADLDPRLIVFDPIAYMFDGDENSNTDWRGPLNALRSLLGDDGPAILIVHHAGKGSVGKSERDKLFRGAMTVLDSSRTAWGLTKRSGSNSFKLKCMKMSRSKEPDPVTVFVDVTPNEEGTGWQECSMRAVSSWVIEDEEKYGTATRQVTEFLRANPGAITGELRESITGSQAFRLDVIQRLEGQGLIYSEPGDGRAILWYLAEPGDEFSIHALPGAENG